MPAMLRVTRSSDAYRHSTKASRAIHLSQPGMLPALNSFAGCSLSEPGLLKEKSTRARASGATNPKYPA